MTPTKPVLLLAASGLALTLAGCKVDNRPLLARLSGQPPAYAALPQPGLPDIDGSPGVYPAGYLTPARAYPYAERAYAMDRIAYQAPPAYGFAYGDEQPWVWEAADDGLMFAEPYGEDYRFYYYEPGAAYPYFVRDDEYGYAYGPNGALLALFDAAGALIAADRYDRYYPEARGYWSRGYDLHRAYGSGRPYAVDRAIWAERAPRLRQVEQSWIEAPQRQPAWRDWRASHGERFAGAEVPRPAFAAPRFDNGRRAGFAGDGRQFAAAPTPGPQSEALRGRGPEGGGVPGFAGRNGREAAARLPQVIEPHDQPGGRAPRFANAAPPVPGGHGGGGHGGRGAAQAQIQAQAQPQRQGGPGGGGHGGGGGDHGGGRGAPQAQPQPQGQGGGHGGGGHGGGGNGRGEGHGH